MSKKTDLVAKLVREVDLRHPYPEEPPEGLALVDQGAVLVLMRYLTEKQAVQSIRALKEEYVDWNEARVSQAQEVASHLKTSSRKKGPARLIDLTPAARALKEYLQEVFQVTHGLDIEFLREDTVAAGKVVSELSTLGLTGGGYLLWLANDRQVPVHPTLVRILDRLGLIARTTSMKKARASIEPLVPKGKEREFTLCFHEIAERWNDPDQPIYVTVEALRSIPAGKKAYRDRQAQLEREEVRRQRDEERQRKAEERERERQRREDERARKKAEADERKRVREEERKKKAAEREKEKKRRQKEAEAARKKKKAAADRKQAAQKKKAAARKKAAGGKKTKTTRKKAAAASSKKKKTAKKSSAKKAKKAPAKKKAAAKKTRKKASRRR